GAGSLFANIVDSAGNYHQISSGAGALATNRFQHVALTYDKITGTASLFNNGIVVTTQNLGVFSPQTAFPLYLGKRTAGTSAGTLYKGLMDEASIYNRALSAEEIASIYQAARAGKCVPTCVAAPAGLVSWWPAEANGNDLRGGNTGNLQGNTSFVPAVVGQAFQFDGTGDGVVVGNPANLRLQNFTIEAWIRRRDPLKASDVT